MPSTAFVMATDRIPEADAWDDDDRVLIQGVDKGARLARLGIIPGAGQPVILPADLTNATTGFVDIPGLALPVAANRLQVANWWVLYQTDATTTGIGLKLQGPAGSLLAANVDIYGAGANGLQAIFSGPLVSYSVQVLSGAVNATTTRYMARIEAMAFPAADGSLYPQFRSEVDASTVTVFAKSAGLLTLLG